MPSPSQASDLVQSKLCKTLKQWKKYESKKLALSGPVGAIAGDIGPCDVLRVDTTLQTLDKFASPGGQEQPLKSDVNRPIYPFWRAFPELPQPGT